MQTLEQVIENTQTRLVTVRKALKRAKGQYFARPQSWNQKTESAVAYETFESEEQALVAFLTGLGVEVTN